MFKEAVSVRTRLLTFAISLIALLGLATLSSAQEVYATLTGTVTDDQRVYTSFQYAFDGGAFIGKPLSLETDSTVGSFQIPTTGLSNGSHTLTVVGRDQAGNTVTSSAAFIIDTVA